MANRVTGYRFHSEVVFTVRMQAFALAGAQVLRTESGALLTQHMLTLEFLVEARASDYVLLWRQKYLSDQASSSRRETSASEALPSAPAAVGKPLPAEEQQQVHSDTREARNTAYQQAVSQADEKDQQAKEAADIAKRAA